ncbi:aminoglycoside phosphotransferase family protein [Nordella sp. HKS 07]|uniref:phosphotransferase family protein n=1 Tax=Nordella sp. HKS 07 TaxID=2712222 RepID=UPI0013E1D275|nr:aminoglycoside phosphotransferase family protein [Nordella sp. HKS 07]QIG46959.1 aminoglycoside phosphotransferase family protein [Nordella sp. HKS 07]
MTQDITPYRDAVIRVFPDLATASFRPLTMGFHSLALDVDDRLIFKFPRGEEAEEALRREARILAAIRPHVTLPVPDLDLIEEPMLFSRHTKIKGEHLVREQYEKLPTTTRDCLADDLAQFYAELHALDPAILRAAGATAILPWRPLADIRSKALPLVPAEYRALCERTLDAYEALTPDPLGATYGFFDGHGWNMAFDHGNQRINGVYDFADSGFGPLHQDFIYSSLIAPQLTLMIAERYGRMTGNSMEPERIGILIGMHRLSDLAELADDPHYVEMLRDHLAVWARDRHIFG